MGRASKLRLLARLHGKGLVTWSGPPVPVVYDLDVFGGGVSRIASGFLDGDFAAAHACGQDETARPTAMAARLRLENGGEIAIQIVVAAPDLAEIEAPLTSAEADLLSAQSLTRHAGQDAALDGDNSLGCSAWAGVTAPSPDRVSHTGGDR